MSIIPRAAECCALSDIGLKRQNNEDVFATHNESNFYALADGMGGHQAGEIAADLAVKRLCTEFIAGLGSHETCSDRLLGKLTEAMHEANAHVYQMASSHRDWAGMGTTLSCLFLLGDQLLYAHVGDSRIYRYRGKLEQLTQDHSLRKEFPHTSWGKNKLTRAIGTSLNVQPETGFSDLQTGDIYLLCSDGLTDHVSDEEITAFIQSAPSLPLLCQTLVDAAKAGGGLDNITVILVKI